MMNKRNRIQRKSRRKSVKKNKSEEPAPPPLSEDPLLRLVEIIDPPNKSDDSKNSSESLKEFFSFTNLVKVLVVLGILIAAHVVAMIMSRLAESAVRHVQTKAIEETVNTGKSDARRSVAYSLVSIIVYWVVMIVLLSVIMMLFNIHTTVMAAVVGAVLFAVGLGLQGTLGDLAAGVMLVMMGTFNIGDFIVIESENASGTVLDFTILYTRLIEEDSGVSMIMPNRVLYGTVIVNKSTAKRYNDVLEIAVSNQNRDLSPAMAKVVEVVSNHPAVLKSPPVTCNVSRMEPLATILELRFALLPSDAQVVETTRKSAEIFTLVRMTLIEQGVKLVDLDAKVALLADATE